MTTARKSTQGGNSESSSANSHAVWSGKSVWGVALAAGAAGWGLASSRKESHLSSNFLPLADGPLLGGIRPIKYASMAEMEQVGSPYPYAFHQPDNVPGSKGNSPRIGRR